MPKKAKSQWDFGELFPAEELRKVYHVSELTRDIRKNLEQQFGRLYVTGEVTNLRVQSSGHIYFSLKDAEAQLSCVLFRGEPVADRHLIEEGRKMIVQGDLSVYEPRGQYQLIVRSVELLGVGALQQAFERLKRKLQAEGLFDPNRKRPLPPYPQRIGLVTSPTGAAIRDILHVVGRRFPGLRIILAPCRVQGEGAAGEIAEAIRRLNAWNQSPSVPANEKLDLILITRGGGSIEDLWAFNEEVVARAVCESELPVVSAVGHEIDFTISDFVADARAATPSAAAEMITDGMYAGRELIANQARRLHRMIRQRHSDCEEDLRQLEQRLSRSHPRRRIEDSHQKLDDLSEDLSRRVRMQLNQLAARWESLIQRFSLQRPERILTIRRDELSRLTSEFGKIGSLRLSQLNDRLRSLDARLRLLSPNNVLDRGYSITTDAQTGAILRSAKKVSKGQRLHTRLKDGDVDSVVE